MVIIGYYYDADSLKVMQCFVQGCRLHTTTQVYLYNSSALAGHILRVAHVGVNCALFRLQLCLQAVALLTQQQSVSCCCCVEWLGLKAWKLARCLESSHSLANGHFHGLYLSVSCECQPCTNLSVVFVLWVRFWIVPMAVRASLFSALQIGSDAGLNRNLLTCSVLKVLYVDKHKCTSGIHSTGMRQTCLSAFETSQHCS